MKRQIFVFLLLSVSIVIAAPIPGDINGDGKVGFEDFLILAQNFGKTGDPFSSRQTVTDTVRVTISDTISVLDTVSVSIVDTTRITVYDTTSVRLVVTDTARSLPNGETLSPVTSDTEISIASFNIRIYSTGSRDDSELELIADRLQQFDLIAIQELRDVEVLDRTRAILSNRGHSYSVLISQPLGRSSQTERYVFMWRPEKISNLDNGQVWNDEGDLFSREPFYASFRAGSFDFTLITMHSIFGDRVAERRGEAEQLDEVWTAIQNADTSEQDVILLGDFNLPPDDSGFDILNTLTNPLFTGDIRTTITQTSLYDNIWLPSFTSEYIGRFGVDRFDQAVFNDDDSAASLAVSDHRPIWAVFNITIDDD